MAANLKVKGSMQLSDAQEEHVVRRSISQLIETDLMKERDAVAGI